MATGWLKGLGAGLAAAGPMVSQGMMADAQARREAEREAMREASAERHWNKEAALRKTERQEDATRRDAERKADFAQRDKENTEQTNRQKYAVDASNARTDKQLALMERRALVDDVNSVEQAGMTAIGNIQKQFLEKSQELIELYPDPVQRAAEVKKLDEQLQQAVGQVNAQVTARRQQVAGAYGDLGQQYLQNIEYETPTVGLFKTPDTSTGKEDAGGGTDGIGKKIPTVEVPESYGFSSAFDLSRQRFAGDLTAPAYKSAVDALKAKPKSRFEQLLAPVGEAAGGGVGYVQGQIGGLYDAAFKRQ